MSYISQRRKHIKREAKETVFSSWLLCCIAALIFFVISAGLLSIKNAYLYLISDMLTDQNLLIARIAFESIIFLVLLLLSYEYYDWNISLYEGEIKPLKSMLDVFSSARKIKRAFRATLAVLVRLLFVFAIPYLWYYFVCGENSYVFETFFNGSDKFVITIASMISNIILLILFSFAFLFSMRYFPSLYIIIKNPHKTVNSAIREGAQLMRGKKIEILLLYISFIGWLAISLFSLGVLFIVFTFPYFAQCMVGYCSYCFDEKECEKMSDESAENFIA